MATTDLAAYVAAQRPGLLRAAVTITRNPHDAEDLLQAALVNVASRWDSLREPAAAGAYMRRAMLNQHATWMRRAWRTRELSVAEPPEHQAPPPGEEGLPAWWPDAAELWQAVLALPPRQSASVVLRYYEGRSEIETARIMECAVGTVKSNTARGLAALRRQLDPEPEGMTA